MVKHVKLKILLNYWFKSNRKSMLVHHINTVFWFFFKRSILGRSLDLINNRFLLMIVFLIIFHLCFGLSFIVCESGALTDNENVPFFTGIFHIGSYE